MDMAKDKTLDVDLAGPDCDLQDDDFRMLEEDDGSIESVSSKSVPDGENPESDDDLDSIPNLFRNRAALKAAFTGSQDKEKGRSIENAQENRDKQNIESADVTVEADSTFGGHETYDELLDYEDDEESQHEDHSVLNQAEEEPELFVNNEERFSDEEDEDNAEPSKPDQPLSSNTVPDEPSLGPTSSAPKPLLSSPGNRVAGTRGRARRQSAPRFETTTQVNPILFHQINKKIVGTNQVDVRIFNLHSPGLQAVRDSPQPSFNNFPLQTTLSHQPALQRRSPVHNREPDFQTRSLPSQSHQPALQRKSPVNNRPVWGPPQSSHGPALQQVPRRSFGNGHSHSLVRNLGNLGRAEHSRQDYPLPKPHYRNRYNQQLPLSSHSLELNPASSQMPVDLNAKPTCELGDYSSLTVNPGNSHASPVLGGNPIFRNRDNPPINPFDNSSDLRSRVETKDQQAPSRTSKLGANFNLPPASSSKPGEQQQTDEVQMKDENNDSDDDDIVVDKVVIDGTAYIEIVRPKLEPSANPENIDVIDLSSDDEPDNDIQLGSEIYPENIRATSDRIAEQTAKALDEINNSQPIVPPEVMRGNINNPKFKKYTSGNNLKRRSDDLRQHLIAKKPRRPKRLCVVVENLPDKIYGDEQLVRLLAESFGIVDKVTFVDLMRRSCRIVFKAEDVAESFYLATNEKTYIGQILVCHEPERIVDDDEEEEMPRFA